ncbi:Ganglioside-induced differentiation-associated protein 1 [Chionoecetes opilio]|uniref:Ganglioside-induced differentiation-associated protein 1 n=1 Tax=Chionoecetes opilio TaxID=41210 RepID=A0A8J4YHB9_CHIOP|nr:Ganglioside-induced differentiation-associated protein 1 [Chionoecetes opilio]
MSATTNNGNGNSLKLYYHPMSFYSQRVLMTLHEKRVSFKKQVVSLFAKEQYESWFLRLNPRGEVPVLTDGVKVIPDSVRIIEYLEDNFCNGQFGQLTPREKGSEESKKIQAFRECLEGLPVAAVTYGTAGNPHLWDNPKLPFTPSRLKQMAEMAKTRHIMIREQAEKNPEFKDALLEKAAAAEHGNLNLNKTPEEMDDVLKKFDVALGRVEEELATHTGDCGGWWLCGEVFSMADIELSILLNRLYLLGHEKRFWAEGKRPHLQAYWERIQQRASFKRSTQFCLRGLQMASLHMALKEHRGVLASLTAALGLAALSYALYRRVNKS